MPPHRTTKSSTLRRRAQLENSGPGRIVMRPCNHCIRLEKECRVGNDSDRCLECVRAGRKCDLAFSVVEWKRVKEERDRVLRELLEAHKRMQAVQEQMQAATAKATRLQTQFEFLEKKEQTMVEREYRNIAELEEEEKQSSEPTLDDLLFDVSSEQIEVPPGFDWSDSFAGTVAEASGSL